MATEVNAHGEPCRPSLIVPSFVPDGDFICHEDQTERLSLAAVDPFASDGAFASGPPSAAPDAIARGPFKHPYFD